MTQTTVIAGIEARGMLLGGLVASRAGLGFVEIRKEPTLESDAAAPLRRSSSPDYSERSLELSVHRTALQPGDRILLIDDWIETGAQAATAKALIEDAGATWLGVASIVDELTAARRRKLNARGLLRATQLP